MDKEINMGLSMTFFDKSRTGICLFFFFSLISFSVSAQYYTVQGSTQVIAGTSSTYIYTIDPANGILMANPVWTVTSQGSITSSTIVDQYTTSAVIQWNTSGSATVTAKSRLSAQATLGVSVITCTNFPVPTNITIGNIICGSGSTTITATPSGGASTLSWFNSSTGGAPIQIGLSLPTGILSASKTYYVASQDNTNCYNSPRAAVNVVVNAIPAAPTSSSAPTICKSQTALLSAIPAANSVINWYDVATGGTALPSAGNNFTTPPLSATTTYYVESFNSSTGCISPRTAVTATVVTTPITAVGEPSAVIYGSGSTILNVAPGSGGDNVKWYDTNTSQPAIFTGQQFTTPVLTATKTYYVTTYNSSLVCESETRSPVNVTVIPLISPASIAQEIVRINGITQDSQLATLSTSQKSTLVSYLDGLQRVNQQIAVKASPSGKDVVRPVEFDAFGRTSKNYLPYVASSVDGSFHSAYSYEQSNFYNTPSDKIEDDLAPFAISLFEDSPLGRVKQQGSPGQAWQPGTNHTTQSTYSFNLAGEVRQFNADGTSTSFYATNTLSKIQQLDENGNAMIVFQDFAGKPLLKRQQLEELINGSLVSFLDTYYLYDELERIKYVVSPKGTVQLAASGWTFSSTLLDQYVYQFAYDAKGRVIEKKTPGQAWRYFAYDQFNRLVLAQDGFLKNLNKWIYIKYDNQGRPVSQGLYLNSTTTTRSDIQLFLDGLYVAANTTYPPSAWYEDRGTVAHGYTNRSFPQTNADNSALEVLTLNYYDGYDFDFNGTDDFAYTPQGLAGEGTQGLAYGLPTGSKRLVMGTNSWLYSYVFFDRYGRTIQIRGNNHLSLTIDNLSTTVYNLPTQVSFESKPLIQKTYHNAGAGKTTTVVNKFEYTAQGLLKKIFQNNDNAAKDQLLVQYDYNELGQLVTKKLHNLGPTVSPDPQIGQSGVNYSPQITSYAYSAAQPTYIASQGITLGNGFFVPSGSTFNGRIGYSEADAQTYNHANENFMQVVDYRYNIRGWLTNINNSKLAVDGTNGDTNDLFGLELLYNKTETGLNDQVGDEVKYNSAISAMKWKGPGGGSGTDNQRSYKYNYDKAGKLKTANSQVSQLGTWTKEVGVLNEALTYDHNGNIVTLKRKQNLGGLAANGYTVTSTAQLIDDLNYTYTTGDRLSKVEDAVAATIGKGDFKNGSTDAEEYTYDNHGSMTVDKNKGISLITYNFLKKPVLINFTDGRKIEYTYDAAGTKLCVKNYNTSGVLQTTTDYVGGFVYTNNNLSFFSSPEGRVVKNGSNLEYQYAIADHQGNTRVLFTSAAPTVQSSTATFESAAQIAESNDFRDSYPAVSGINVVASNANTGTSSQLLNGGYRGTVGVAKSYKVYPGDKVKIDAYARYSTPSASNSTLADFATNLLSAFALPAPGVGELGTASSAIQGWGTVAANGYADGSPNNGLPKAFVNIILFDKNYKFIDVAYAPVTSTGAPTLISAAYTVKEEGYAYLYISNEQPTQTDVYFDDVIISFTPSNVVQYNEYYPFGLQTQNSWTRDNALGNNFLGNGGTELNTISQTYDLLFRNYDPALGRFGQVDPLADSYTSHTPYQYALNNPVSLNDPFGDRIEGSDRGDWIWRAFGGRGSSDDSNFGGGSTWAISYGADRVNVGTNVYQKIAWIFNNNLKDGDRFTYNATTGIAGIWVSTDGGFAYGNSVDLKDGFTFRGIKDRFVPYNLNWQQSAAFGKEPRSYPDNSIMLKFISSTAGIFQGVANIVENGQVKPRYTGPKEWAAQKSSAKSFGTYLGVLNLLVTGVDATINGPKNSHGFDLALGGTLLIAGILITSPVWAPVVAGLGAAYFAADYYIYSTTKQGISSHLFD
jgi:RHS repeat-associated protein